MVTLVGRFARVPGAPAIALHVGAAGHRDLRLAREEMKYIKTKQLTASVMDDGGGGDLNGKLHGCAVDGR